MGSEEIRTLTEACFLRHSEQLDKSHAKHLKVVKRAINTRVGLPIGILCAMLGWVLVEVYGFKSQVTGQEVINDTQTISIAVEGDMREKSDEELKSELKALSDKFDSNTRWLIENMNSKYRGPNPLLTK